MMRLLSVYSKLPVCMQNVAFSLAGAKIRSYRYGPGFHRMLNEFEEHTNWTFDRVANWRDQKLRELIDHAYRTVPYYHSVMKEGGINPSSIRFADDLKVLPLLTKDMIKARPDQFVSSEARHMRILHVHTSGTTGSGFQFDSTVECQQAQFACFWRYYRKLGLTLDTWQAQFSSRNAVPRRQRRPPFWRIDCFGKRYYMSAFHENPDNLASYYECIARKRFEWISGYPSLMVLLAQWMNERGLAFDFVRAVTCGAENLYLHQIKAMEGAFGVEPRQTYGQTENVAIFSQDPDGHIFVDEDFSVVEFLPVEGSGSLQIVGTCLFNFATPLIRYCTNDEASVREIKGQRREILSLDGRNEDYVILPDGTKIGKLDHVFKDTPCIREAQIYQYSDYSVVLKIVGDPASCRDDAILALKTFRESVGDSVDANVEYVSAIERRGSAKLRYVVSEVERNAGDEG